MVRKPKKKQKHRQKPKLETNPVSTDDVISKAQIDSDNVVRLKVTVRKGARIESVPLKKLEKLSNKPKLHWKLEDVWLILYGIT